MPRIPANPMGPPARINYRRQKGSIYFLVLAVCLLTTVISLGAITLARVQTRNASNIQDMNIARLNARSAIEFGTYIANQSNFRNTFSNGMWLEKQPIGTGTLSIQGTNPNGPLNNNDLDPINLLGIGYKGAAMHMTQVQLIAKPVALDCLSFAALAAGAVSPGPNIQCNQTFASNTSIIGISLGSYTGTYSAPLVTMVALVALNIQAGAPVRAMPDPSTVFNYYTSHGTPIAITSLPLSGSARQLQFTLLSASANPFGNADPQGIYVIDCQGQDLQISSCRLVGTLVILNPGSNSVIQNSNYFAPGISNYPTLMVKGNFTINPSGAALADLPRTGAHTAGVNYNPPGTPYNGVADTTFTTSYPCEIDGLVYISGNLTTNGTSNFNGVVISGGNWSNGGNLTLAYGSTFSSSPPPGFFKTPVRMVMSSGTFTQVVH